MTLRLVLGGTRSGKSARAERLAVRAGLPVAYLATGAATDDEMAERIAAHRKRRPAGWSTVEGADIATTLRELPPETCVLVDDLDGWVTRQMTEADLWTDAEVAGLGAAGRAGWDGVLAKAAYWCELAKARPGPVIVTAGQPGGGLIPPHAASRRWLDLHGEVVQVISGAAEACELVVAGRALPLPAPDRAIETAAATFDQTIETSEAGEDWLRDHGDTQVPAGTIDLAVNVLAGPPTWLAERLARSVGDLAAYPDQTRARAAAANRHGRRETECLVLNGAAEAFWLLAHALRPRHAVCVHPTFTEGEAALRNAGVRVQRVFREPEAWRLDPADIPDEADFVLITRPDNPTGALDPVGLIEGLCRPGRTVVIDEAFADFLPDGGELAERGDLPGLVVVRSLTKLWGLAGLRTGYLLAEPELVSRLAAARQPWSVGTLALEAIEACAEAEPERRERAGRVAREREALTDALSRISDLRVWPGSANFILVRAARTDLRARLLADGLALRRGETFPGLDPHYLRIAVRDQSITDELRTAIIRNLKGDK
ncbi:Rv2231c family pyridoxal phosphate-dependent protein CobC [Glycomyces buryatensis]|uniref:Threonine-phosphate decarboxylase n=1 Tax=Glycomyces buryatensis TaxID=2570927 RepID=A0A4S8QGH2_9ACTN|nr:Rv2231c family pyridoxal phosphate-dependent protein CobC [Glycomyces buryatensis]THV42065.1 threonine-phosphate decarboxylase [Glycomyces buryatensis]